MRFISDVSPVHTKGSYAPVQIILVKSLFSSINR
jgi:hypothetical protein